METARPIPRKSGRGLFLVAALSARWDWYPTREPRGKVVWCEIEALSTARRGAGDGQNHGSFGQIDKRNGWRDSVGRPAPITAARSGAARTGFARTRRARAGSGSVPRIAAVCREYRSRRSSTRLWKPARSRCSASGRIFTTAPRLVLSHLGNVPVNRPVDPPQAARYEVTWCELEAGGR
jgi:hypothetical protein